jgi:hypothetical protein
VRRSGAIRRCAGHRVGGNGHVHGEERGHTRQRGIADGDVRDRGPDRCGDELSAWGSARRGRWAGQQQRQLRRRSRLAGHTGGGTRPEPVVQLWSSAAAPARRTGHSRSARPGLGASAQNRAAPGAGARPSVAGVGQALAPYDPRSDPARTIGILVAAFTLLQLSAGTGGLALARCAGGVVRASARKGSGRDRRDERQHASGPRRAFVYGAVNVKLLGARAGRGRAGRSITDVALAGNADARRGQCHPSRTPGAALPAARAGRAQRHLPARDPWLCVAAGAAGETGARSRSGPRHGRRCDPTRRHADDRDRRPRRARRRRGPRRGADLQ